MLRSAKQRNQLFTKQGQTYAWDPPSIDLKAYRHEFLTQEASCTSMRYLLWVAERLAQEPAIHLTHFFKLKRSQNASRFPLSL